jgi:hypothetical protein
VRKCNTFPQINIGRLKILSIVEVKIKSFVSGLKEFPVFIEIFCNPLSISTEADESIVSNSALLK